MHAIAEYRPEVTVQSWPLPDEKSFTPIQKASLNLKFPIVQGPQNHHLAHYNSRVMNQMSQQQSRNPGGEITSRTSKSNENRHGVALPCLSLALGSVQDTDTWTLRAHPNGQRATMTDGIKHALLLGW